METYQIVAFALAAIFLILYMMRRRSRMNRED
jgi:hypothetical protein